MKEQGSVPVKMLLKCGVTIQLNADQETLAEVYSHPKFVSMTSNENEVLVSLDDIIAFEVVNNPEQQSNPEDNAKTPASPIA